MSVTARAKTGTTAVDRPANPPVGKTAPAKLPAKVTKVDRPTNPPVGKKPVKKVAAKKVVGTMAKTQKAKGKQGKVPAVGFGKQRVNANKKMLLLAKAKQEQRKRAAK